VRARRPREEVTVVLSPGERRERNREEMRRAILDAARAVMREQGVAALSLREVARRVKMQAPSLYAYFPNKMALYDGLFADGIRTFLSYRNAADYEPGNFREALRAKIEAYMQFASEHPELYQLCFERPVPGFVPSAASMEATLAGVAQFEGEMADMIATGEISPGLSARQARDLTIAMMHGLTSQHMANEPHMPVGSGRYGGLIEAAVALFDAAWGTGTRSDVGTDERARQQCSGDGKEVDG
jgi:AcrR family transcriptional regulator